MASGTELTSVATVHEEGSWLFTARDRYGDDTEVVVVPCGDGVAAWVNRCTHENQRLDRGIGAVIRDGEVVCPKHGSMFDACSGGCDNGPAAGTSLVSVDVAVRDGTVVLVDDEYWFVHAGEADAGGSDEDEGPGSTSHIGF